MSTLGPRNIQRVELHWPRYGTAWARVETIGGAVPTGPAMLTIADIALMGHIVPGRSGENSPAAWVGIWESGLGWDTPLPSRPAYQNDSGVRLKSVITDLAVDCGMSVVLPADAAIGSFWCRSRRSADDKPRTGRDELDLLVRRRVLAHWWMDATNATRFGDRTLGPVKAAARVLARDSDRGRRVLGIDSPLAFAPGGTFEGAMIERLIVHEDGGSLTCETYES